jgi:diguanylate cyclase (GGDEF)-like protein
MTASYSAMFPGLFSATGLLGAGSQSTSAMYMFWHAGFPFIIIGYVCLKYLESSANRNESLRQINRPTAILSCIGIVWAIVSGFTLFVTAGRDFLPVFIYGDHTTTLGRDLLVSDWVLSLIALFALWRRRPHTVIDVWLMVVMSAWLFDVALSAILNTGRYDLGWDVGRGYGLLAASFLLVVLLIENGNYHARLVRMAELLKSANRSLEQLSNLDGLTNIANRRFFDSYLLIQMGATRRYQQNLALVMWDVDAFKAYNDHYGHPAGDECLKQIVGALKSCCHRPLDIVARFGGEEFAMILPDTDLTGALHVAEAVRATLAELNILHEFSPTSSAVSISGGVAVMSGMADTTVQELISAADRSLYQAKMLGRNRIVCVLSGPDAEHAHVTAHIGDRDEIEQPVDSKTEIAPEPIELPLTGLWSGGFCTVPATL